MTSIIVKDRAPYNDYGCNPKQRHGSTVVTLTAFLLTLWLETLPKLVRSYGCASRERAIHDAVRTDKSTQSVYFSNLCFRTPVNTSENIVLAFISQSA